MKMITISVHLSDELGIKKITLDHNSTELKSDYILLRQIAVGVLKSIEMNKESILVQDLLDDMDIDRENT